MWKKLLQIEVKTSSRLTDTSWSLKDLESNKLIWSKELYSAKRTIYKHERCIDIEKGYIFIIFNSNGIFFTSQYYKVVIDNDVVKYVERRVSFYSQNTVICSKNEYYNDNNSCTIDECNSDANQYTYKAGICIVDDGFNGTCNPQTLEYSSFTFNLL